MYVFILYLSKTSCNILPGTFPLGATAPQGGEVDISATSGDISAGQLAMLQLTEEGFDGDSRRWSVGWAVGRLSISSDFYFVWIEGIHHAKKSDGNAIFSWVPMLLWFVKRCEDKGYRAAVP